MAKLNPLKFASLVFVTLNIFQPSFASPVRTLNFWDAILSQDEDFWNKRLAPDREESECKDLLEKCAAIPLKGAKLEKYCQNWREDPVVSQCRKTCGWCKAPSPTNCEDERDDCDWILLNAPNVALYCQKYIDDPAVRECRKTCGHCNKFPAPTKKPSKPETQFPPKPETGPPVPATQRPITTEEETGEKPVIKPTKPTSGEMSGFEKECLDAHNMYRARHGVPPLTWSRDLARGAQFWANTLALENKFVHYKRLSELGQGENLAFFAPANRKCDGPSDENCVHCGEIVKDWYDEIKDYDFNRGAGKDRWSVVLHFTQVVWRGSTVVGMATAVSPITNKFYSVARYKPAGNQGSNEVFKDNVPPVVAP